ncbi:hypothetical protein LJD22_08680 [Bacillus velezensis]|nr:hypothetical protein [Bacillus velezensis]
MPQSRARQNQFQISRHLDERVRLSMTDYDRLLQDSGIVKFGTRNAAPAADIPNAHQGKTRLVLTEIKEFHRKYEWTT